MLKEENLRFTSLDKEELLVSVKGGINEGESNPPMDWFRFKLVCRLIFRKDAAFATSTSFLDISWENRLMRFETSLLALSKLLEISENYIALIIKIIKCWRFILYNSNN